MLHAAFSASLRSCLASAQNTKLSSTRTFPHLLVMSVLKNNKTIFSIFIVMSYYLGRTSMIVWN
jgi:uncharacterized protein with NRDE domain